MGKKKFVPIFLMLLFLILITIKIYAVTEEITFDLVRDRNNPESQKKMAEILLSDAGKADEFSPEEVTDIRVFYGDVSGNSDDDAVFVISIGPGYSIVSAYAQEGDRYKYLDSIEPLGKVEGLEFVRAPGLKENFIIIHENINQQIGSFENSTYHKIYLWDGEVLREAAIFPEKIHTDWNLAWDSKEQNPPSQWRRIDMDSEIFFTTGNNSEILINLFQKYLESSDTTSRSLPDDSTYSVISERTIPVTLKWSPEWRHFIVKEKIENATGEKVAVIIDTAQSPYALVPEYAEAAENKYRILRKDGSQELVDKSSLSDV